MKLKENPKAQKIQTINKMKLKQTVLIKILKLKKIIIKFKI